MLQQWHVLGEVANSAAVLFSNLTFEKSDFKKDKNKNRKGPLIIGDRKHCSSPPYSRKPSKDKIKKLSEGLLKIGQVVTMGNLLQGNNYEPSSFFTISVRCKREKKEDNVKTRECVKK